MSYARLIAQAHHSQSGREQFLDQIIFFVVERGPAEMTNRCRVINRHSISLVHERTLPIVAKTITVDGDDLETAEMIQAGLHPTAQQVQENTERFSKLGEYDVKAEATVSFAVGSTQVSAADKEELKKLAQTAIGINGYLIEVKGFADSSGNAIMNEQLSEDRAEAVVGYLVQQCSVPVRHVVAPGALGEYQPAASNETNEGRAQNRRVEVKVLVNKGIAGS